MALITALQHCAGVLLIFGSVVAMRLCIECRWCRENTATTYRCDLHRKLCFEANSEACGEWRARESAVKGDREDGAGDNQICVV